MIHSPEFLALVNDAKTRIRQIGIDEYQRMTADGFNHLLIDTREESEWAAGRISGSVHMGRGVIERDIVAKVPDKSKTLVLYCGGGYRSALAADNLQKMGYRNVISLEGGWRAWTASGLPTEV